MRVSSGFQSPVVDVFCKAAASDVVMAKMDAAVLTRATYRRVARSTATLDASPHNSGMGVSGSLNVVAGARRWRTPARSHAAAQIVSLFLGPRMPAPWGQGVRGSGARAQAARLQMLQRIRGCALFWARIPIQITQTAFSISNLVPALLTKITIPIPAVDMTHKCVHWMHQCMDAAGCAGRAIYRHSDKSPRRCRAASLRPQPADTQTSAPVLGTKSDFDDTTNIFFISIYSLHS